MFNNIISGNYIPQPDMLSRPANTVKQVQVYNRPVWINSNEIPTNRRNFANVPYNTVGSKLEGINTENFISHNTSTGQTQDNYQPSIADNVQVYSINETAKMHMNFSFTDIGADYRETSYKGSYFLQEDIHDDSQLNVSLYARKPITNTQAENLDPNILRKSVQIEGNQSCNCSSDKNVNLSLQTRTPLHKIEIKNLQQNFNSSNSKERKPFLDIINVTVITNSTENENNTAQFKSSATEIRTERNELMSQKESPKDSNLEDNFNITGNTDKKLHFQTKNLTIIANNTTNRQNTTTSKGRQPVKENRTLHKESFPTSDNSVPDNVISKEKSSNVSEDVNLKNLSNYTSSKQMLLDKQTNKSTKPHKTMQNLNQITSVDNANNTQQTVWKEIQGKVKDNLNNSHLSGNFTFSIIN